MNYFRPLSFPADQAVFAAWDSQVEEAKEIPWLQEVLARGGSGLFSLFAVRYAELSALPRSARRALQRRLARSGEPALPAEWQGKLAGSLAGAALLLALGQGAALANTITVNTANHGVNNDGKCSLVEAIHNANDTNTGQVHSDCAPGDTNQNNSDTIVLPKRTFTLTSPSGYYYGSATGLPLITSKVTIQGNGAKLVHKKNAPYFRHFAVAGNGAYNQLRLYGLTLSGGYSRLDGGAIVNYGRLYIYDSIITGNASNGYGGAIENIESTMRITNSTISKNVSYRGGGGVSNYHAGASIYGSLITGNYAYFGGGINNFQAGLLVVASTISKNAAYGQNQSSGGGIHNQDAGAFVYDSLITGNYAAYGGGGIDNFDGGYLKVDPTTISNNTAFLGGGVANSDDSTATLNNTTITGNKAEYGGGIFNVSGASAYVDNTTITKNVAFGEGGGIYNDALVVMEDSSVTKNKSSSGGGGVHNHGTFVDNGGNLINGNKPTEIGS